LELQAHWARYLCVLAAGFLENAIVDVYGRLVTASASPAVARFAARALERIQNPNCERFIQTAGAFKAQWGKELEEFVASGGRKEAIDAIMAHRHQIAHGGDSGITISRLKEYVARCVEVVEFIEIQCER
jgi:hypothetical protein